MSNLNNNLDTRESVYNHFLDLRNLLHWIDSNLGENFSPEEMQAIANARNIDPTIRKHAIEKLKKLNPREMTIQELKDEAQRLGIRGYSRLNKVDLQLEIQNVKIKKEEINKVVRATAG